MHPQASWSACRHRRSRVQVEALVCDDTRRADILVTVQLRRVIVEADGPWHFVRAPDGSVVHRDGTTALRDRLLRAAGYEVLSVRLEDKAPSDFRTPDFRRWLQSQLQDLGLACSAVPAQVWLR
jgi:RAP domain